MSATETKNLSADAIAKAAAKAIALIESVGDIDNATSDQVLELVNIRDVLNKLTREVSAEAERVCIIYIGANGDISDGKIRYYVAPNKSYKCRDLASAVSEIRKLYADDREFFGHFSTSALKPGMCRDSLGDRFEQFFTVAETLDLKTGKPTGPRLQKFDPTYSD